MNARILAELIQVAVKKAVREELKSFKTQIINEIRNGNSNGGFDSEDYYERPQQRSSSRKKYTNDSTLNEILNQTRPLDRTERAAGHINNFKTKKGEILNVPTDDLGNPMRSVPSHVLEAMNRNYSDQIEVETPRPKPQHQRPVQQQMINPDIRSQVLSYMEPLGESGFDQYEEDEDLSFLNEVG